MNDILFLATLLAGPMYGYQIKKWVGLISGQSEPHNNTVYPTLHRFEQQGWVSKQSVPGKGRQIRHEYALTPEGTSALLRMVAQFSDKDAHSSDAFQLRIGLFPWLDAETRTRILDARETAIRQQMERLQRIAEATGDETIPNEIFRFRNAQSQTELDWIDRLRRLDYGSTDSSKKGE